MVAILTLLILSLKNKAPNRMVSRGVAKKRILDTTGFVAPKPKKLKYKAKKITRAICNTGYK